MSDTVFMPDGKSFQFWDDRTVYDRVHHVACTHPAAADDGPGSEDRPWATIGQAARLLQPGEKVIVHGGIYRERINPTRRGGGPERMIAYEAAPGEAVYVRGSEMWQPKFVPSAGWNLGALPAGAKVWMADLPRSGSPAITPSWPWTFPPSSLPLHETGPRRRRSSFLLRRGMIFLDGVPLQVYRARDLAGKTGAFWVEDSGLRIHLRLENDADPNGRAFEVTTQEQVFAPLTPGLGYIRVSGFHLEHSADVIPVPQRAMVSATRGHHWIIEDNVVCWANAVGIDVGNETWHRSFVEPVPHTGQHIIRRNHVSDCGICGIAAVGNNNGSLVEENTVERIGGKRIERIWETGGLKFHIATRC